MKAQSFTSKVLCASSTVNASAFCGDAALVAAAKILRKCFHNDDFIARFAGDEFVVIFELQEDDDIYRMRERLDKSFKRLYRTGNKPYNLSVSMGGTVFDRNEHRDADGFLATIDALMYQEKNEAPK